MVSFGISKIIFVDRLVIEFKLYELLTGERINCQFQVAFKFRVNQSNLQVDIPAIRVGKRIIRVDHLMLQATKKYNLMKISRFVENITC